MIKLWILILIIKILFTFQICIEGKNFCSKCNPVTKLCVKCEKDIYIPDEDGGCEYSRKCILGKNHCLSCTDNERLCESCEEGYYPDNNGGCSYSNNCEISYQGKCLKCIDNFVLIGKNLTNSINLCKSLNSIDLRYCEKINTEYGTCEGCKEGYYLSEKDKKCTVTNGCSETKLGECVKCKYGHYIDKSDNKCKVQEGKLDNCELSKDGITCDICRENFHFNKEKECLRVRYCEKVNNYYKCLYCADGYYLIDNENVCTPEENCIKGDRDFGICTECKKNYYIDKSDAKCRSNQEDNDFKFCEVADGGKCIKCNEKYFLGEDGRCSLSKNCAESKLGTCNKCIDSFYLGYDHKCTNVENCIYSNYYYECIECEGDLFVDRNTKKCVPAEGDYEHCKSGYKSWLCLECKDDYYLNMTNHLCYSNLEDNIFYKCIATDSNAKHCSECAKNYYLGSKDRICTSMMGCAISENRIRCRECQENYCLNVYTGKCIYNNEIVNEEEKTFYRCNRTNIEGTACEVCNDGLILNENKLCVDKKNCVEVMDNVCQKCKSDYCLNNIFGCIEVIFEFNYCLECNDIYDFNNCTKCIDGYELDEYGKCTEIEEETEMKEEEIEWEDEWNDNNENENIF